MYHLSSRSSRGNAAYRDAGHCICLSIYLVQLVMLDSAAPILADLLLYRNLGSSLGLLFPYQH